MCTVGMDFCQQLAFASGPKREPQSTVAQTILVGLQGEPSERRGVACVPARLLNDSNEALLHFARQILHDDRMIDDAGNARDLRLGKLFLEPSLGALRLDLYAEPARDANGVAQV